MQSVTSSFGRLKKILVAHWGIAGSALIFLVGVSWYFFGGTKSTYQFITVTQGSITETISVTGNTTPTSSVSLGFQNTGTIAHIYRNLGDHVSTGEVIAELNTANLLAALQQAEASLAVAKANLAALNAGTRPEQLSIDESAVVQDQIALANAIRSAYSVADGVIHKDADQMFTNGRTSGATLTITVPDAVLANTIVQERITLESVLIVWSTEVGSSSFDLSDPTIAATNAAENLTQISTFLNDMASALTKAQPSTSISTATLSTYQSNIATARTSVASAQTTLTSAKTTLVSAEGTLALAQSGSTPESIAAQEAQVAQAQAGVASARANLMGAKVIAPINGLVTQLDAKIGQLASPGTPLVSLIGYGGFEVDAGVSEIDVGKLAVGNIATMTLDAFPNETFMGSVFYIAPAQTNTQGVISYQIKISFSKADPRLKSGLTANIDIQTKKNDNVLILPQYAILQNDAGTFVKRLIGTVATIGPVTLGIQDQKGNVEILSGVTLGERVINIGLKAAQ